MKTKLAVIGILFTSIATHFASETKNADVQMRIPFHVQAFLRNQAYGIAAWAALPNVFAKNNETALFFAGSPLFQYDTNGGWIEILGGMKINENGYKDPLINIRFLNRNIPRVNIGADLEYFPRKEQRRFYSLLFVDTPIKYSILNVRAGIESENIFSFANKRDAFGIGPRLSYTVPMHSTKLSAMVTTSYQWRTDQDIARIYLIFTYKYF